MKPGITDEGIVEDGIQHDHLSVSLPEHRFYRSKNF